MLTLAAIGCGDGTTTDDDGSGVLSAAANNDLVVHGDRAFWQTDSLGWVSSDGATCQNLVFGDWPDAVGQWGVTDDYASLVPSMETSSPRSSSACPTEPSFGGTQRRTATISR